MQCLGFINICRKKHTNKQVKFGDSNPGQIIEDLSRSYSSKSRGEFHYLAALNNSKGNFRGWIESDKVQMVLAELIESFLV